MICRFYKIWFTKKIFFVRKHSNAWIVRTFLYKKWLGSTDEHNCLLSVCKEGQSEMGEEQ